MSQEKPLNRCLAVFKTASHGPLTSCSEISLHGRSARVEIAENICIVGPLHSENLFKAFWQSFEGGHVSRFLDDAKFDEPLEENLSCNARLHNISSVKAVHTIGPEDSFLSIKFRVSLRSACLAFKLEVTKVLRVFADHVEQLGQIFILHVFALGMEIKPDQAHARFIDTVMHLLKVLSHSLLRSFFVDQVEHGAILIVLLDVEIVFAGDFGVKFVVGVDLA